MVKYNSVISYIKKDELVKLTQDLIRINSVFDPEIEGQNELKVAEYVFSFLKNQGFEVIIEKVVENRPNIIATLNGTNVGKTILFEGHLDVVTAGNLDEWTKDPFGGEINDGKIYGRGACDTKGNLAAAIYAVKAIKDSGIEFNGKIILCIPCDEEGMMIGIKDFIKKGHAKNIDGAIICEPEENQICIFQKGAIRVGVTVFGKQAHGCMPLAGINPNTRLAKIILELEKFEKSEKRRLGKHKYLGYPSVTPTIIISPKKGERQINVVPSEAYMTLDIRTVPGQKHSEIINAIETIFIKLRKNDKNFKATLEVIEERPWTQTDKDDPIVESAKFAYRKVTSKKSRINGVPGATDGTFLSALEGIPVVVTGAGGRTIPHQGDEYVEIEELFATSKIYATCALNFLAGE
jgi:succinyl-diaminopimelate desuccinylase